MTSTTMSKDKKPYLIRAIYQWIIDNGCTPHLIVASPDAGWVTGLDDSYLQDEFLVLNISPNATPDCLIEDDGIYFSARFNGKVCQVSVAIQAVAALIARENGQGYHFELLNNLAEGPEQGNAQTSTGKPSKSHLKIVR